jgi:hypothetical protein
MAMMGPAELRVDRATTRKLYESLEGFCLMLNIESGRASDAEIFTTITERHGTHFAQLWWHARQVLASAQLEQA